MKGQISVDLIFTILLAIIAGGALLSVTTEILESQERIALHRTLEYTALDISTALLATQGFSKTDTNFYIEIPLETIRYKNTEGYPLVTHDATKDKLIVKETLTLNDINAQETTPLPARTKIKQTGRLVVIYYE